MELYQLPKIKKQKGKRLGRGYGSGVGGHTVGRGQKGQKTRSKINPLFEGTKTKKSLIQRLPLLRGRGKNKGRINGRVGIQLSSLERLPKTTKIVNIDLLVKYNLLDKKDQKRSVKIIGNGKLARKFIVCLPTSAGASKSIKAGGGEVKA